MQHDVPLLDVARRAAHLAPVEDRALDGDRRPRRSAARGGPRSAPRPRRRASNSSRSKAWIGGGTGAGVELGLDPLDPSPGRADPLAPAGDDGWMGNGHLPPILIRGRVKLAILSRAPRAVQHPAAAHRRARPRPRGQGAQHAALRHRPVGRGAGPAVPRQAALRLRRDPAADRQLDHLLRHRRGPPVRADGRLHAQHGQRHHQLPRQAARHPDPVPARHRRCRPPPSCATAPT